MAQHLRKPDWLKIRLGGNEQFTKTKSIVESHCLHTICTSGKCPNMGECWSRGTATFMIGGEICTRSCRFCNTLTGIEAQSLHFLEDVVFPFEGVYLEVGDGIVALIINNV